MTKAELVTEIADKAGLNRAQAKEADLAVLARRFASRAAP